MAAIRISYKICKLHKVVFMSSEIGAIATTKDKAIVLSINVHDIFFVSSF